jgi:hypothetical protein
VVQRRDARAHLGNPRQIDVGKAEADLFTHVEQDLAPRIDDQ